MKIDFRFEFVAIHANYSVATSLMNISDRDFVERLKGKMSVSGGIDLPGEFLAEIKTEQGDAMYLLFSGSTVSLLSNTAHGFDPGDVVAKIDFSTNFGVVFFHYQSK